MFCIHIGKKVLRMRDFFKKQNLQVTKLMRDFVKDKIYNKVLFLKKFLSGDKKSIQQKLGRIFFKNKTLLISKV